MKTVKRYTRSRKTGRKPAVAKYKPRYKPRYKRSVKPYTKIFKSPGFPDRMMVKLNYVGIEAPGIGDNLVLHQGFMFQNSLFDPDSRAGGHQPLWYDQWATIYSNYRVKGWSYYITVQNLTNAPGYVAIRHQDIGSGETNPQTLFERKDVKWRTLTPSGSTRNMAYFKGYLSVAKTVGQTPLDVNTDDTYMATFNANPVKKCWLATYMVGGIGTNPFQWTCKLTYYAELSGRISPGGS